MGDTYEVAVVDQDKNLEHLLRRCQETGVHLNKDSFVETNECSIHGTYDSQ